ncbi:MAG: Rossman fold protein, TIGR00730 family [Candidatus Yanofskybacteria bacterium RIFCSPHIGHO2_01_FULL_45_42]|uniref:Cytokinin riboside 5'-monophosphate phosphoribohydrolase n=3 Tax=Candidatus Yanofskyibacteriota TaxID=1752733 RepID=A0A1F8H466_9BACT|nr:MAG: Rossman fold protein, TIGR00730 family [Candidatus Yanofskybacteria bacterium RIFCSPHIGHO2_01_FULL_45_42]OGN16378.1 MAG: Rossman fold protein, TIGR00730 family [Candidatus Yanofskybacteria bacterium RIFCSPHIGHO2_02_FULL_46_19]OGN27051.1 MAG: Rossman fold protein, TIGR00730 family [Candidatus Yanofskybacteria bacterium RIFCSPLOWO2_01_FULL_45_72]OGN32371.1 MAG: Rossman fold protein, TIGR00730 family [Candidatus Yanofskybacteria bacterium RIFCSPLOWO2_02_FULL_45_18]
MDEEKKGKLNLPASKLPVYKEKEDFRSTFQWRVFRIMAEFVDGWQFLADFRNTVSFFGSARFKEGERWYEESRKLGALLAKEGIGVVTGGGPGIMEAGNRGAFEAGGESLGINIKLPFEQRINPYVQKSIGLHYFFVRKVMLSYAAKAYVFFPGGFGTLDEAFELLTLIQTKKIAPVPCVLVGKEFWTPMHKFLNEEMLGKLKAIDTEDLGLYSVVDTAEEAFEIVRHAPPRELFY